MTTTPLPPEPIDGRVVALAAGPDPEFLTVTEAAALLRVAEQTVRNELAGRRLPGKKIGKEWRLSRTALIGYLSTPGTPRTSRRREPLAEDQSEVQEA